MCVYIYIFSYYLFFFFFFFFGGGWFFSQNIVFFVFVVHIHLQWFENAFFGFCEGAGHTPKHTRKTHCHESLFCNNNNIVPVIVNSGNIVIVIVIGIILEIEIVIQK